MRTEVATGAVEQWPLEPWARVVAMAQESRSAAFMDDEDAAGWRPDTGRYAFAPAAKDRGASAVEWVVITAVVVGIVGAVAAVIGWAVKGKATQACNDINNTTAGASAGSNTNCTTN